MVEDIDAAARSLTLAMGDHPIDWAMVLGSGLSSVTDRFMATETIPYSDVAGFPVSQVEGHAGEVLLGSFKNAPAKRVLILSGRCHYYEGHNLARVTLPIRVLHRLNVSRLILTNASGGINTDFSCGDCMVIRDQLNLIGASPLQGENLADFGTRFPDMSNVYSRSLRELALGIANSHKFAFKQGVFAGVAGPQYETPAEVAMLRVMGADAVGMSTVSEAIVASHQQMQVLGFSIIANAAGGTEEQPVTHEEVVSNVAKAAAQVAQVIEEVIGHE